MPRKLLVLDTSYGYEIIRARQLEASVTCRDLGGFFEHVWTIHPFASLVSSDATRKFGEPDIHSLDPAHTFLDGKIGRFPALSGIPLVNFALGQADVIGKLISLIRKEQISVIRTGDPLYNGVLGWVLSKACGIPLVVRVNVNLDKLYTDNDQPAMPRLFRSVEVERRVFRFVFSHADLVVAPSRDSLEFALRNGARPESTTVFRYGNLIDKRHVAAPETRDRDPAILDEFGTGPGRFLLCIGRLETFKWPGDAVRVLGELRKRGHVLKLLMVGDGQEREALGLLARELSSEDDVVFCGNRDQDWLSRVIPLAAAVVSPLTGRALAEAAFGAAPIAAYDLDWQGELIETGRTGELVPARSWNGLADAVERFIQDPAYARKMGVAARQRAFQMLDPETLDEFERKTYVELLARFENPGGRAVTPHQTKV